MVKDRFKELHAYRRKHNLPNESPPCQIQIEGSELQLLQLLDKIGPLYAKVKTLNADAVELRKGLNDYTKNKLAEKISDVKAEARNLYKAIQEINNAADTDSHLLSHVARTHHSALVYFFSETNTELSNLQEELIDKHKKYVEKELKITGHEVTDEELENLLDKQIFNQNILIETQMAKQQLFDIQKRHEEVINIEKSIVEVNQLFQELAMLVRDQGEKLDRIENNVFETQERANLAKTELKEAQVYQKKARKKKFILFGILIVVLLIVILIIVLSL